MHIDILTPHLNMLAWLPCCCASVADQTGVSVRHLVVDGGSSDGSLAWLKSREQGEGFSWLSEPDRGMYEALNKGMVRLLDEPPDNADRIVAWLNADEQYLPGALAWVADWFKCHPDRDMLFGSSLLIRPDGELLAYRRALPMRRHFLAVSHLYNLSCATFFRARLWAENRFDESWRNAGDMALMLRLLRQGARSGCTARPLAAFTWTGQNLSCRADAQAEQQRILTAEPAWIRYMSGPLNLLRWTEKALRGGYRRPAIAYAVYVPKNLTKRTAFRTEKAPVQWPGLSY